MEVPQWVSNQNMGREMGPVLILILMEVPQWVVAMNNFAYVVSLVLILILMEVPQWVIKYC